MGVGARILVLVLGFSAPGSASPACDGFFHALSPQPRACFGAIETDRPHRTDTPVPVPPGHVQAEAGLLTYGIARGAASLLLGDNSYKLGLFNRVDLGLSHSIGDYSAAGRTWNVGSPLRLRAKIELIDAHAFELSLVPVVEFSGHQKAPGGYVFLGAELPGDLEFELNLGAELDPGRAPSAFVGVAAAAATRPLAGELSGFLEIFTELPRAPVAPWEGTFDGGFLWRISPDVQLDWGFYARLRGKAPPLAPFLGISARL